MTYEDLLIPFALLAAAALLFAVADWRARKRRKPTLSVPRKGEKRITFAQSIKDDNFERMLAARKAKR